MIISVVVVGFVGTGFYAAWQGVLINANTIRVRPPAGDSRAWCREECVYLTLSGIRIIRGEATPIEIQRKSESQCTRLLSSSVSRPAVDQSATPAGDG